MKKLLTCMSALLLSVMCLGVVSFANSDDGIDTHQLVGEGGEPCTISGSKNYSTATGKGTSFTVTAKSPTSVSYVGVNVKITYGTITASNGSVRILSSKTGVKNFEHKASRTTCKYVFTAAKSVAGYNVNNTFTVTKP